MKNVNAVINHITSECCMAGLDKLYAEYRKRMNHALKNYIAGEISKDEYVRQTAKITSKFITKVAVDTAANTEVVDIIC